MVPVVLMSASIAAAAAYALFSLQRGKGGAVALSFALIFSALLEFFDLLAFSYPENLLLWKRYAILAEGALIPSWVCFSLTYAREHGLRGILPLQKLFLRLSFLLPVVALLLPAERFFYSPDFVPERVLFLGPAGYIFYILELLFLAYILINLESTLLNASHTARWKIKFEIIGSGAFLAVLLFYYSHALLYRAIDMTLIPVRSISLIMAVSMIAYADLKRDDGVRVYVSKQAAYKSVVLLVIGGYLVWLGLIGEWMKHSGSTFQRPLIISIMFATAVFLVIALLSESVRRKIKVFLHKNFYANKYDYRVQWLMFTDRLASSRNEVELLKSILSGFCETFGLQGAALFLLDPEAACYTPVINYEMGKITTSFNMDNSLIVYLQNYQRVFSIHDDNPLLRMQNQEFLRSNGVSFIVPLTRNRELEGFIALGKALNKGEKYSYEDFDLMKTLARQAYSAILNLKLSEELAKAREMEAIGKVSAYVLHDLKNLVGSMALMAENGKRYMHDRKFQEEMLRSLDSSVGKVHRLIERLKKLKEKETLKLQKADLLEEVKKAAVLAHGAIKVEGVHVAATIDVEEMQKVFLNLMLNALEATHGNGPVDVEVGRKGMAYVRVIDHGCGMSEEFLRDKLFQPFNTTKQNGLGVGLYQSRQIVISHGGKIDVTSKPGQGSTFAVYLPAHEYGEINLQEEKSRYN